MERIITEYIVGLSEENEISQSYDEPINVSFGSELSHEFQCAS